MRLYTFYCNEPISQLQEVVLHALPPALYQDLDRLLDLTVLKTIANQIAMAQRPQAVSLFRADPSRLAGWLDQDYPAARIAIVESLTRTLLSLTVE